MCVWECVGDSVALVRVVSQKTDHLVKFEGCYGNYLLLNYGRSRRTSVARRCSPKN